MFNKIKKRLMSVLLAAVLVFSGTDIASATEVLPVIEQTVETEDESDETAVSEAALEDVPAEVGENESPAEETAEDIIFDSDEIAKTEETIEELLPEIDPNDMEALGFSGMELSSGQLEYKYSMAQVAASLPEIEEGEDCVDDEVVFFADSSEEAEEIARCYNAELLDYSYGVGRLLLRTDMRTAVTYAAYQGNSMPAVFPNLYYSYLDDEIIEETDTFEEVPLLEAPSFVLDETAFDAPVTNDELISAQAYLSAIEAIDSWKYTKGEGVTVAVVDSGIDEGHPDFVNGKKARGSNIARYISVLDEADKSDKIGHGTHCCGIIAAVQGNGIGVSGVAPEADIIPIQISKSSTITTGNVIKGVNAAIENNVDIINLSLGIAFPDAMLEEAINRATDRGMIVVAAAGNSSTNAKSYPAAYGGVIAVAATLESENYLDESYSNYGSWVDISAPGTHIMSTVPRSDAEMSNGAVKVGYSYSSGTSMASPVAVGVIALLLSNDPSIREIQGSDRTRQVLSILASTGDMAKSVSYRSYKYPRVNALGAMGSSVRTINPPQISFFDGAGNPISSSGGKVASGEGYYFRLTADKPYAKIYYTVNGVKPTPQTGIMYDAASPFKMEFSGKMKVQAIAVAGKTQSKVSSATYTCEAKPTAIRCYGGLSEMTVVPGKSIQLLASVLPSYASSVKCTYSISGTVSGITVNATSGKLTCKKGTPLGTKAVVTATVKDNSSLSCTYNITVASDMSTGVGVEKEVKMSSWIDDPSLPSVINTNMKNLGILGTYTLKPTGALQYIFKSSNVKVATVDSDGNITPGEKNGSAKITVTANDGSGKKAVCKVTVVNPVYDIEAVSSTGFDSYAAMIPIGNGCSIKMQPTVNFAIKNSPHDAPANKKLKWTSSAPDVVTVSSSGTVKCAKNAPAGRDVTITAEAKDGFGAKQEFKFQTVKRTRKLRGIWGRWNKTSIALTGPVSSNGTSIMLSPVADGGDNAGICGPEYYAFIPPKNGVFSMRYLGSGLVGIIATRVGTGSGKIVVLDGGKATFKLRVRGYSPR